VDLSAIRCQASRYVDPFPLLDLTLYVARQAPAELTVQAFFQDIRVTIVALALYGYEVASLGVSGGASLEALVLAAALTLIL